MKIPGESQLKLSVYDYDFTLMPGSSDQMLGETTIDLEDRWFHKVLPRPLRHLHAGKGPLTLVDPATQVWQRMGGDEEEDDDVDWSYIQAMHGRPKLIEGRDLFHPEASTSRGKLFMWAEIISASDARSKEPVNFEAPQAMEIEIRVIIWALASYSTDESSMDYYVKTYLHGDAKKKKETDTHWRCKNRAPQWNWRHKHKVSLWLLLVAFSILRSMISYPCPRLRCLRCPDFGPH